MSEEDRDREVGVTTTAVSRDVVADETCAVAVVDAVATVTGQDVAALPDRLADVVDTDALESLVSTSTGATDRDLSVSFLFCGCRVTVTGDRRVFAQRQTETTE